jgi:hypothetical protein
MIGGFMKPLLLKQVCLIATVVGVCPLFQERCRANSAQADKLGSLEISINSVKSEILLERMVNEVRTVFHNYKPGVDATTRIVSMPKVTGSSTHPFVNASMEKCVRVLVVDQCQTVDLNADVTVTSEKGQCAKNLLLKADISKSSSLLSDQYSELRFHICFNRSGNGKGSLRIVGDAVIAPPRGGIVLPVKDIVLDVLKLQLDPIGEAIKKTLKTFATEN